METDYAGGGDSADGFGGGFTSEGDAVQLNKIRTIFRIALANGHDSLVMGAFGCGAFQLPPEAVAEQFARALGEPEFAGRFRIVIFAILEVGGNSDVRKGKFAPFYYLFG
ncbi:MAG: TIGR02452 family protein [Kiritimatiellae bacterium]|nr:TIGR02452 family protein [Kiritimatiellia bacterium]